ncbi:hypothetical protein SKAU_G00032100 [Synaphobranchus kaupii]|uniref:C2H2-type domain-containing protein n=1 Tax=Synaphobranchus kaupii TaxID=118154 RepID=A0A9Q1GEH8_SYNKA|nr:hypothetical protein SKAU_G00032100 [Synaphobranchus kaupii]
MRFSSSHYAHTTSWEPEYRGAMADSVKTFQSHLTSVMDSLIRASVCEITKLFQDTVNDYLVEISLNRKENEALKLRLRLTENKLRNERKYGMGWAASRRTSGLLVSDESGRKKRRAEIPRVKQREDTGFGKDWVGSPWEEGGAAAGGAGEEVRDVFLVQLQGAEEDEDACVSGVREEAAIIKEESTEMESGYRPESLRLIQEVLQMDPPEQNMHSGPRIHLEGDVAAGTGLPSVEERGPAEQGHCEEEWVVAPPPVKKGVAEEEGFGEQHRPRTCMVGVGVELNGLETALKAERGDDRNPAGAEPNGGGNLADSAPEGLGELEYAIAQKYIGLDGMCSSEQDTATLTASAQTGEREADGLLEAHSRLGFGPTRGIEPRPGWPKRVKEGDGVERLVALPGPLDVPPFVCLGLGVGLGPGPGLGEGGDFVHFCAVCGAGFASATDLEDHPCLLPVQNQDQDQNCAVCGKTFGQSSHLRAHMRLHAGEPGAERPYHCAQCGRSFNQPWNLKNHECVHSGERPHRCQLCGKRFTHSRSLERHQLVHTGERPHRCPQCGRSFSRLGNLERHQRIHTGERPYACTACGKRFSRVEYLKRHQQIHSGESAAHQCIHCGKAFSEPELLKNHQCIYNISPVHL